MPTETPAQTIARLRARPATGRPPKAARTADARLLARVLAARPGLTRTELAEELGCVPSALSQAHAPRGLAAKRRAALEAMVKGK